MIASFCPLFHNIPGDDCWDGARGGLVLHLKLTWCILFGFESFSIQRLILLSMYSHCSTTKRVTLDLNSLLPVHSIETVGRRSVQPRPKGSEAVFESFNSSGGLRPVNWCTNPSNPKQSLCFLNL